MSIASLKKTTEISGWYSKGKPSEAEKAELRRRVDEWLDRRIELNYRQIVVEAPGKMILVLGRMAQEMDVPFGDFIESILAEYLERQQIDWR